MYNNCFQQAIQKLQFHDFPLTTASLSMTSSSGNTVTQAKILSSPAGLDLPTKTAHSFDDKTHPASKLIPLSSVTMHEEAPVTMHGDASSNTSLAPIQHGSVSDLHNLPPTIDLTGAMGIIPKGQSMSALNCSGSTKLPETLHHVVSMSEKLGQVSSLLESSPITHQSVNSLSGLVATPKSPELQIVHPDLSRTTVSSGASASNITMDSSTLMAETSPKSPTSLATRTRRIRTPRQFDA